MLKDALVVFATGWLVFLAAAQVARSAFDGVFAQQVALKLILLVFAFLLIAIWRRGKPGSYGLRRASGVRWRRVCGVGLALGAAASLILLLGGGRGLQGVFGSLKLYQIVIAVCILSSVSEEVFTRGWAQGAMGAWNDGRFSPAVITSAALFGSMHLTLIAKGVDALTVTVIVVSATVLGLYAGQLRERHAGLSPAIAAHIAFNVGGMIGGVLYTVGYRLTTGRLPFSGG